MNIYIICPVRNADRDRTSAIRSYVKSLRIAGHDVHFPPDDVPQDDPVGVEICKSHLAAMRLADEVHVFWNPGSFGSHFDLGMAYALGVKIKPIQIEGKDVDGKSYWKVINAQ